MCSFLNKKEQKESWSQSNFFECKTCDFKTSRKFNLDKHLSTEKHKLNNFEHNLTKKSETILCKNCNKMYQNRSSLWYHKKKCVQISNEETSHVNLPLDKETIMMIHHHNNEFKEIIIEQSKQMI